jgi:uncharacterized protein YecT (DUF1311 family)
MIVRALLLAALAFLSLPGVALAQAKDCSNAATQMDMNFCAGAAQKSADDQLNKTYNTLVARIDGKDALAQLRDAEKAWIVYRDRECTFESSATVGGSIHSMIVAQCLETMTRAREKELRRQLNCQEGDMSCVLRK